LLNDFGYPDKNGDSPLCYDSDEWCGVFVYNALDESGFPITRKDKSWKTPAKSEFYLYDWNEGKTIANPTYGAIVRMNYSHVAFVVGFDDTYLWILGGNQQPTPALEDGRGTEVNIRKVEKKKASGYSIPSSYKIPPLD
jgi:hypothetical protein